MNRRSDNPASIKTRTITRESARTAFIEQCLKSSMMCHDDILQACEKSFELASKHEDLRWAGDQKHQKTIESALDTFASLLGAKATYERFHVYFTFGTKVFEVPQ